MKLQHVPLDQIVWNPWRDKALFPISEEQIAGLRESIKSHGFFSSVKGRRRNGKIELGCGHARFEAARKARLDTMPIFIDDLDDDQMLHLMVDENALQSGANAAAIMNEVAAVTRRLIEIVLGPEDFWTIVQKSFGGKKGIESVRGRLFARAADPSKDGGISRDLIRSYLGEGNPERSSRPERAIREAVSALKQSGRYDDIIDEILRKYPPPIDASKPAEKREIATTKPRAPKRRILDERCAGVFDNDHQFHAFREAVTTQGSQKVLPVDKQYALAKSIMKDAPKKQVTATYVKRMAQATVQEALKTQRNIDKDERELYLREQAEARIDEQVDTARMYVRSLKSAITKMIDLAEEFPGHPKIGGFSALLDGLVGAIQQLSKKLK